jgi:hypothetical protein
MIFFFLALKMQMLSKGDALSPRKNNCILSTRSNEENVDPDGFVVLARWGTGLNVAKRRSSSGFGEE